MCVTRTVSATDLRVAVRRIGESITSTLQAKSPQPASLHWCQCFTSCILSSLPLPNPIFPSALIVGPTLTCQYCSTWCIQDVCTFVCLLSLLCPLGTDDLFLIPGYILTWWRVQISWCHWRIVSIYRAWVQLTEEVVETRSQAAADVGQRQASVCADAQSSLQQILYILNTHILVSDPFKQNFGKVDINT